MSSLLPIRPDEFAQVLANFGDAIKRGKLEFEEIAFAQVKKELNYDEDQPSIDEVTMDLNELHGELTIQLRGGLTTLLSCVNVLRNKRGLAPLKIKVSKPSTGLMDNKRYIELE